MKTRAAALALAVVVSTSLFAAPKDDSPRGPIDRAIAKIVRVVKHILHPQDDLTPPHP